MAEITCPRCGAPLHDRPDYCWSCGFYVGDRWRTVQLEESDPAASRIVEPVDAATGVAPDVRVVGGDTEPDAGSPRPPLPRERWVTRAIALALVVIVALLALALFGGRAGATSVPSASETPAPVAGAATALPGAWTHGASDTSADPAWPAGPSGPTTTATVVRVVDGDTIVVDIDGRETRVRYIGMDTPESVKPDTPVEPYALAASSVNHELVDGREVILERDVSDTDQYGRLLRNVWVDRDGRLVLVGLDLVRRGLAQVTTYPPDVAYVDALLAAQAQARTEGLGIWAPS